MELLLIYSGDVTTRERDCQLVKRTNNTNINNSNNNYFNKSYFKKKNQKREIRRLANQI